MIYSIVYTPYSYMIIKMMIHQIHTSKYPPWSTDECIAKGPSGPLHAARITKLPELPWKVCSKPARFEWRFQQKFRDLSGFPRTKHGIEWGSAPKKNKRHLATSFVCRSTDSINDMGSWFFGCITLDRRVNLQETGNGFNQICRLTLLFYFNAGE